MCKFVEIHLFKLTPSHQLGKPIFHFCVPRQTCPGNLDRPKIFWRISCISSVCFRGQRKSKDRNEHCKYNNREPCLIEEIYVGCKCLLTPPNRHFVNPQVFSFLPSFFSSIRYSLKQSHNFCHLLESILFVLKLLKP